MMKEQTKTPTTIDEFVEPFPAEVQEMMQKIRQLVHQLAPTVTESISYGIPTFKLKEKNLVHFSAYQKHIGFYPGESGIANFVDELSPYKSAKGSVQFPLSQPIPYDLIQRIVEFRIEEMQK